MPSTAARHSCGTAGASQMGAPGARPDALLGYEQCRTPGRCVSSDDALQGQGAASAIEDAVVLARCLARVSCNEIPNALAVYAANRKECTARMQLTNRENTWLRFRTDTDWVYDFDACIRSSLALRTLDVAVRRRRTSVELANGGRQQSDGSHLHCRGPRRFYKPSRSWPRWSGTRLATASGPGLTDWRTRLYGSTVLSQVRDAGRASAQIHACRQTTAWR